MSDNLLDIFTESVRAIFEETGIKIDSIRNIPVPTGGEDQVVTSIGITGEIKGNFILLTNKQHAKNISDTMLSNMSISAPPEEFSSLHEAAIGEIANQISGRAITILSEKKINSDITPPTMLMGDNIKFLSTEFEDFRAREFSGSFGTLYIIVGTKNHKKLKKNS